MSLYVTGTAGKRDWIWIFLRTTYPDIPSKRLTLHTYAKLVTDPVLLPTRFRLSGWQSSSDDVFVIGDHFGRCHPDGAMMRVIVRMQQVVENVQVASRIRVSEITKRFRL